MPRWLYYLLIMAVVAPAIALFWGPQQALAIFISSTLALIPLAALIGRATEDLEFYVGPTAGGLLNATFGNAPELIIGIFALQAGLVEVVKASMIGSIISNSLLVFGSALAFGGWRWGRQYFSSRDAGQYTSMMLVALAGMAIPSASASLIANQSQQQAISIAIACVLLLAYGIYLTAHVFGLRSERRNPRQRDKLKTTKLAPTLQEEDEHNGHVEAHEPAEPPPLKLWMALLMLCLATLGTAWNSELLVNTIEPVTKIFGWSTVFVGLVIIPIIGNAAEHSSSIYIALRDRVDLSMAIAAGSSIQVATFVTPVLVVLSMFFANHMSLTFPLFELVVLGVATLLFWLISRDGESSWLAGVQLITVYLIACIAFFFIPG